MGSSSPQRAGGATPREGIPKISRGQPGVTRGKAGQPGYPPQVTFGDPRFLWATPKDTLAYLKLPLVTLGHRQVALGYPQVILRLSSDFSQVILRFSSGNPQVIL